MQDSKITRKGNVIFITSKNYDICYSSGLSFRDDARELAFGTFVDSTINGIFAKRIAKKQQIQ